MDVFSVFDSLTVTSAGLGGAQGQVLNNDFSSPRFGTLAPGLSNLTSTTGISTPNGYAPPTAWRAAPNPAGLMPLPAAGMTGTLVSTGLMPRPDVARPFAGPVAQPVVRHQPGLEQSAINQRTDRENETVRVQNRLQSGLAVDSALEELASAGRTEDGRLRTEQRPIPDFFRPFSAVLRPFLERGGDLPVASEFSTGGISVARSGLPREPASWSSRLAVILLAAGSCGRVGARARQAGVVQRRSPR